MPLGENPQTKLLKRYLEVLFLQQSCQQMEQFTENILAKRFQFSDRTLTNSLP